MLEARRRHGARLIAIDPRRTITTARCDWHLMVRPGTDHILALAVAHVLLDDDLADIDFASQAAVDFDEYRREASQWSPGRAANICGIAESDIVSFAHEFGRARPAVIRTGIASQQTVGGEEFVRGLSALAAVCS
jgi:anaerobic selenocysteine-containing dehydrogenase